MREDTLNLIFTEIIYYIFVRTNCIISPLACSARPLSSPRHLVPPERSSCIGCVPAPPSTGRYRTSATAHTRLPLSGFPSCRSPSCRRISWSNSISPSLCAVSSQTSFLSGNPFPLLFSVANTRSPLPAVHSLHSGKQHRRLFQ